MLRYVLMLGWLLGWAGCATPKYPARQLTPLTGATPAPSAVNAPESEPVVREPTPARSQPTPESAPALSTNTSIATAQVWVDPWLPLSAWCREHHLAKPRLAAPNGQTRYEITTTNGLLTLVIGSRIAYWNKTSFWLGQYPRLVDGTPYLHTLDGVKSLQPLLAEKITFASPVVVVLDPGHGGRDSGAQSIVNQASEKEYTLDWALRAQKILCANGVKVILTRTNDTDLALSNRVAIAEACAGQLFISLHFNSSRPSLEAAGLETYCLTPTGMPSSLTRDFGDDLALVCRNNTYDTPNWQWAMHVHQYLQAATGMADRSVRRARFLGVLRGQNRPAILVEGGFLSNPTEARKIAGAAYRQQLSEALANAILKVLALSPPNSLSQHEPF